jgi:hypothetical protein
MTTPTEMLTYCTVHPDRETTLRCNKCGRLMCAECAVLTPVGYRCRQCIRQQDDRFFSATQNDYAVIAGISGGLTAIAALIVTWVNIPLLFLLFIAVPAGGAIGETALRLTGRRRGRYSSQIAAGASVVGGLTGAVAFVWLRTGEFAPELALRVAFSDLTLIVFVAVTAVVIYSRFQMRI